MESKIFYFKFMKNTKLENFNKKNNVQKYMFCNFLMYYSEEKFALLHFNW